VRVARPVGTGPSPDQPLVRHDAEFVFLFVLSGSVTFEHAGDDEGLAPARHALVEGDTVVIPTGLAHRLIECSADLELLDVTLPDVIELTR
jgi:quercetin dioxygenase-like cupin family protein